MMAISILIDSHCCGTDIHGTFFLFLVNYIHGTYYSINLSPESDSISFMLIVKIFQTIAIEAFLRNMHILRLYFLLLCKNHIHFFVT